MYLTSIEVPEDLVRDLEESLNFGFIAEIDPNGRHLYRVEKALVERFKGLKVEIYANEHAPPHFHVTYQGEKAVFALDDCRIIKASQKANKFSKNVEVYYSKNRKKLIDFWNNTRPSDCPVGPFIE